jgi:hypothetical protein
MAQRAREICNQVGDYYYWGVKYLAGGAFDDVQKPGVCIP